VIEGLPASSANGRLAVCVLVTRPSPKGEALCELIRARGGEAVYLPTIEFAPPPDLQNFNRAISALGEQDWLIFVSPQSVYASVPAIRQAWPQLPPKVQIAAIGAGTAGALHDAGYLTSLYPSSEWNSEGLLTLPEFQYMIGKNVAIIRGVGGREQLEKSFVDRGASVLSVMAYQRAIPPVDVTPTLVRLKQHQIQRIVCTSYDGVSNLKTMLGEAGWEYIKEIPLIVVSDRIKLLAGNLGFQTIWVAANASHEAILNAISHG
jgi:uroporphyrinogen-III synthase